MGQSFSFLWSDSSTKEPLLDGAGGGGSGGSGPTPVPNPTKFLPTITTYKFDTNRGLKTVQITWDNPKITADQIRAVEQDGRFYDHIRRQNWTKMKTSSILVRDVFMFGSKVGFIWANMNMTRIKDGTSVPGAVLISGSSVALLIIATVPGKRWKQLLLVRQLRVGAGDEIWELLAGMVDQDTILSAACKEANQEAKLDIPATASALLGLDNYLVSPGRVEEVMELLAHHMTITAEKFDSITKHTYGENPSEQIELGWFELSPNGLKKIRELRDAKIEVALFRYILDKMSDDGLATMAMPFDTTKEDTE